MKQKRLILIIVLFSAIISTKAQEVASSSGDYQETSNGSLSWTIGEPITETATNGNVLTQGLQQSGITVTNITEINTNINVSIFPNPTNEFVKIVSSEDRDYRVNLYNLDGKLLLKERSDNTKIKINMTPYASGIYLLKITNNTEINTYQIIKQLKLNIMKKTTFTFAMVLFSIFMFAQSPQSFKYQAVYRDNTGNIIANRSIAVQIKILQSSATGTEVFTETHNISTNAFGLFNIEIGSINATDFATIDWANGPYFVNTIIEGTDFGTSQLLSVPYALHAKTAESIQAVQADIMWANFTVVE